MAITETSLARDVAEVSEGKGSSLSEKQLAVLRVLRSAVAHPLAPIDDGRPITSPDVLFEAFYTTGAFDRIYAEAEREALFGDPKDVLDMLKGAVFEEIGSMYLANNSSQGLILLGGEIPYKVVQALNPTAKMIRHPYGKKEAEGKYSPDVVVVRKDEETGQIFVVGGYEISTVEKSNKYLGQLYGFRLIMENLGPIASSPFFGILNPLNRDSTLAFPKKVEGIDIKHFPLPITHTEFDRFVDEMMSFYRKTPEHPTIDELRVQGDIRAKRIREMGEPAIFRLRQDAADALHLGQDGHGRM